jgi:hypothetical protein
VGMVVDTHEGTHYLYDLQFGCPAQSFMPTLLISVAETISCAIETQS